LSEAEGGCNTNSTTTTPTCEQGGVRDGAWLASQEAHHRLTNHHRHPTSCVAAFAPKLRRQAFSYFLLFFRLLIFGNAQLCLYAGQIVNAPKIDTVDCHSDFFFCMYTRIKKKIVTDSI